MAGVAINGDIAVVGADFESVPFVGGNYMEGAAYIFGRNVGGADNWGLIKRIEDPDGISAACCDGFGTQVAISGNTLAVGEFWHDRVHVFDRNEGGADNWGRVALLTPSDKSSAFDFFHAVAIDGDTLAVGAGNHTHAGVSASGAVYVYERNEGVARTTGVRSRNS